MKDEAKTKKQLLAEIRDLRRTVAQLQQTNLDTQPGTTGPQDPEARRVRSGEDEITSAVRNITERRRVEEALRLSETRYRALNEQSPLAIIIYSPDGRPIQANPAAFALWQVTPEHWARLQEHYCILEDSELAASGSMPQIEKAFRGEATRIPPTPYDSTRTGVPAVHDVGIRWIASHAYPVKDDAGDVREVVLIQEDVTAQKEAETALRESEEKYRMLFTTARDAIVILDAQSLDIIDANISATELYGYRREELLQMTGLDLSADPERSTMNIAKVTALAGKQVHYHTNLHRKKDGVTFPVEIAANTTRLQDRPVVYAAFRDITERVQAAAALRDSEERFRELADHISEVFWLFDWKAQRVLYVSPAYETLWGRPTQSLYDRYQEWGESVHPEDREYASESLARITETGGGEERQYRIVRPDGTVRWVSDRGFAIRDDDGEVVRIAGLAEDITERKHAEQEREALIAELEAKNAELERFAYTVSHDLKTPLVTIKGFLGYLEQNAAAGDLVRVREDLARIANSADKMEQLLNDLLDLSSIGRVAHKPEPVPLNEVAREVVDMMKGRPAERSVRMEIVSDLPLVYGDRTRLREVVENLVENAIRYVGSQTDPHVKIGVRREDERVVFYVEDNGMGIEPQHHERVFGLFEKLDSETEGSGVGLAVVKRIVEVHGGQVWVESQGAGQGSTFCFTLADT